MTIPINKTKGTVTAAHIENAVSYIIRNNINGIVVDVVDWSFDYIDTLSIVKSDDNIIIDYGIGRSSIVEIEYKKVVNVLKKIFLIEYKCVTNDMTIDAFNNAFTLIMDMKKLFYLYAFLRNDCNTNYNEDSVVSESSFLFSISPTTENFLSAISDGHEKLCDMVATLFGKNRDKLSFIGIGDVPEWTAYAPFGKDIADTRLPDWCSLAFDEMINVLFDVVLKNGKYEATLKKSYDYSVFCTNDYDFQLVTSIFNDCIIYKK